MLNPKNHVQLVGFVSNIPERTILTSGLTKVNTVLSTQEFYKNKSGAISRVTQWHPIVCWGEQGEKFFEKVKKGCKLYVNGQLKFIAHPEDNRNYQTCHIHVTNFQIIRKSTQIEVVNMPCASEPPKSYRLR